MPPCRHIFSGGVLLSFVQDLIGSRQSLVCDRLLPLIAQQAALADSTRSVEPAVIKAIKQTDIIRMSATRHIGGVEASISAMARELEAVAGCCASTAWCLWNHLCVFHGLFIWRCTLKIGTQSSKKDSPCLRPMCMGSQQIVSNLILGFLRTLSQGHFSWTRRGILSPPL